MQLCESFYRRCIHVKKPFCRYEMSTLSKNWARWVATWGLSMTFSSRRMGLFTASYDRTIRWAHLNRCTHCTRVYCNVMTNSGSLAVGVMHCLLLCHTHQIAKELFERNSTFHHFSLHVCNLALLLGEMVKCHSTTVSYHEHYLRARVMLKPLHTGMGLELMTCSQMLARNKGSVTSLLVSRGKTSFSGTTDMLAVCVILQCSSGGKSTCTQIMWIIRTNTAYFHNVPWVQRVSSTKVIGLSQLCMCVYLL